MEGFAGLIYNLSQTLLAPASFLFSVVGVSKSTFKETFSNTDAINHHIGRHTEKLGVSFCIAEVNA